MMRLNYQPNELARGLKVKRSTAIATIAPNLVDSFIASAVRAVQDVARERGYVVILAGSGGDLAIERAELEVIVRRQIDAIIVTAASSGESNLKPLLTKNVPIVVFDEPLQGEQVDTITVTNCKSARGASEHLLGHGYSRSLAVVLVPIFSPAPNAS
jgi:DNA-binding LacI/PurR family transcriptional regulator